MKKTGVVAILLAVAIAFAALIGCGLLKPTAVSLARDMAKNLSKTTSVKADIKVDYDGEVSMSGMGADVGIDADLELEAMTKTGVSHMKGTAGVTLPIVGTYKTPVESYQQIEDDAVVVYATTDGSEWTKSRRSRDSQGEDSSSGNNSQAILGILQKIISGEVKAELAEDTEMIGGKEVYRMDITVSGALLDEMIKAVAAAQGKESELPGDLDLTGADADITLYIEKSTKLPVQMKIDCTALGNVVMQRLFKDVVFDGTTKQFIITVDFKEYNTLENLEVPEEVRSSAKENGEADILDGLMPEGI